MKIILDNIVFSLQKSGGISVVWYELLSRLFRDHFLYRVFIMIIRIYFLQSYHILKIK